MPIVSIRLEECIDLKDYINIKLQKYLDVDAETNDYTTNIMEEHYSIFSSSVCSTEEDRKRNSILSSTGFDPLIVCDIDTARESDKNKGFKLNGTGDSGSTKDSQFVTTSSKSEKIKAMKDSMKDGYQVNNKNSQKGFMNSQMVKRPLSNTKPLTAFNLQKQDQFNSQRVVLNPSVKSKNDHESIYTDMKPPSYIDKMEEMTLNSKDCLGTLSKSQYGIIMYK